MVTSPPYFALRSYLPKGHADKGREIGSEPTPEAFIATMVEVFRQVRRALRDDGLLFLNLGDSYGDGCRNKASPTDSTYSANRNTARKVTDYPGQLQNMPHRVAEALRADGWIWRQTIVWAKRSPMPESVSGWRWQRCKVPGCPKCQATGGYVLRRGAGRCTTAHEYIFILARSNRYFWDSEGSKEAATTPFQSTRGWREGNMDNNHKPAEYFNPELATTSRNPRTVWTLSSEPTKVRHFATFPSELVRRCLSAGVSAGGCCPVCEAPFAPVVEQGALVPDDPSYRPRGAAPDGEGLVKRGMIPAGQTQGHPNHHYENKLLGYRPTCTCERADSTGCLVCDPFMGIGTTGQTARQLGCRFIGIELNPEYVKVAEKRIFEQPRWWRRRQSEKVKRAEAVRPAAPGLFELEAAGERT